MLKGSSEADDPAAAGQRATPWLIAWHGGLAAWIDRLGWLRTASEWLAGVLGPFREKHQDNLAI
jgi:hypothetical protein